MFTPDRQINPPSFYEKEKEVSQPNICDLCLWTFDEKPEEAIYEGDKYTCVCPECVKNIKDEGAK